MLFTGNFNLRKPEMGEPVDVRDFNYNADVIDSELKKRPTESGNASEMTVEFEDAAQLTEIKSGSTLKSLFGKIALAIKKLISLEKALETHKSSADHDSRYVKNDRIFLRDDISMSAFFQHSNGTEEEVMESGNYCVIAVGRWSDGHLIDGFEIALGYDNPNKYTSTYHNGELSRQWTAF